MVICKNQIVSFKTSNVNNFFKNNFFIQFFLLFLSYKLINMINNFEHIRSIISFDSEDDFYFLQIIKRRKDNPDLPRDMKLIDNYFIYSFEDFDKLEPKIIEQCELNNARAYFRLNRRSSKICALQTLRKISELLIDGNYRAAKTAYLSAAGEYHNEKPKRWIIDIDPEDLHQKEDIEKTIAELHSKTPGYSHIATLPTKNGYHFITNPFDMKTFRSKFPNISIQRDNPTILYCP